MRIKVQNPIWLLKKALFLPGTSRLKEIMVDMRFSHFGQLVFYCITVNSERSALGKKPSFFQSREKKSSESLVHYHYRENFEKD